MVWGLGQPGAGHWRQWLDADLPIGPKHGQNVTEFGKFVTIGKGGVQSAAFAGAARLAHRGVLRDHDGVVTKDG
jgi:hypothetical protein